MNKFSPKSELVLKTCHDDLQKIFNEVIQIMDCTVICGHRDEASQNECVRNGTSKLKFPNSQHNSWPSMAIDVAPCPIDWNNRERFVFFAGVVFGVAHRFGIKIRWGGDFNMNFDFKDERFYDLPHFELVGYQIPETLKAIP